MEIRVAESLDAVDSVAWNALVRDDDPFVSHQFLAALERHGCLGERFGWWPRHLLAYADDVLLAAVPRYLKNNSYGELVFDWAWADAASRLGASYYPKLVAMVPVTPVTGRRFLFAPAPPFRENQVDRRLAYPQPSSSGKTLSYLTLERGSAIISATEEAMWPPSRGRIGRALRAARITLIEAMR